MNSRLRRLIPEILRKRYWDWKCAEAMRRNTCARPEDFSPEKNRDEIRVLWVLAGNEWLGSARVKGTLIHREFSRTRGRIESNIAYMPSHGNYLHPSLEWTPSIWRPLLDRGVDVVSFQTRKGATADLLRDCRDRGIATVFSISDMHLHEVPKEVLALTDTLVVSSEFLAAPARKIHPRVEIVDDPIETPTGTTREGTDRGKSPELIWLGHPGHWKHVAFLYEVLDCKELEGVTLKTISHHPEATVQWTPEGVWEQARHSDIAVIPCDLDERGQAKSSNRLVCFMAMGYPVVCTPIPAYREHIRHGENGYFAVTIEEWRDALQPLLDPTHRETIGERAAKTPTLDSLRLERIAQRWETIFDQSRTTKEKPTPGAISAGAESVRNDSLPS